MGKIIAVSNQKGGTGKTTTVVNLGAALAKMHRKKVLLIDLDPQGSLTIFTGILPEKLSAHLGTVLEHPKQFDKAATAFYNQRLRILPSNPALEKIINSEALQGKWRKNLKLLLKRAAQKYDFVLIDCPPALGDLTLQAFCDTDGIIIPLQCEYMALRGVQLLLETIGNAQKSCNTKLEILGILPTMYDRRTLHAQEVLDEIKTALNRRIHIFPIVIYKTIRFPESAVSALPIFEYDPKNPGAIAYKKLAKEILKHG